MARAAVLERPTVVSGSTAGDGRSRYLQRSGWLAVAAVVAVAVVAALALLGRPVPAWWGAGVVLVVLAWTSLPGAVLAIGIAAAVAWTCRNHIKFALLVTVGSLASAITCVPPSDFSSFAPGLAG